MPRIRQTTGLAAAPARTGPDGQRVHPAELGGPECSGPTVGGVRDPIGGNPSAGLTPGRLASILRAAVEGQWTDYLELAEEMEERDPHYRAVLGVRKRSVAQLPITVEAASDDPAHEEHADLIRRWIRRGTLRRALFDVLDAAGKGFSVHEIIWESKPSHVWPQRMLYRPPRWFDADMIDRDTPRLRVNGGHEALPQHRYLLHIHKDKSGSLIRSGIAYAAAWAWMMKRFTDHDWAQFVRAYGQPIRLGKYDPNSSEEDRTRLWQAVRMIAGDLAAIIPDGMSVEFISALGSGANPEVQAKRSAYLDQQISKLVLGQTTTTDAISGGHAVSQEHREVAGDIERADALLLSASITEQLVPWIISLNFGPQEDYPVVSIGRPDEMPIGEWVTAIKDLAPLGLRVETSQIYDRLGIEEPAEDAETIGGAPAAPLDPLAGLFAREGRPGRQRHRGRPPAGRTDPMLVGPYRVFVERMAAVAAEQEIAEALAARAAREAGPALGELTGQIRAEVMAAKDMADLKDRLSRLKLDPRNFAAAMGRAIELAQMTGRTAVLEDLRAEDEADG
ncbi:DUF935 domain-containing protein [Pannonibacter indicus]|uniref:DUF935 domain-containing protein n=1 Tax=Pannonibacter indicus TaxID=466044 RepID=UPI00391C831F